MFMNEEVVSPFFSGTSGLSGLLPKRDFPPQFQAGSRLTFYASLFNSIEINSSFYKVPMSTTVRKCTESVPDDFRFTFKLWKEITHAKDLRFNPEYILQFMTAISNVGIKKGCLLVQFPPSFHADGIRQLEKLLSVIQSANLENQWNVAIEFRNRSWYIHVVYDLLNEYRAVMVFQDLPASATPWTETGEFIYLRLHGPNGGYRGSYTEDFLSEYAHYIKDWRDAGKPVYVYFNNTMGDAFKNLVTLNDYSSALMKA